jgi:hypothetical protein
MTFTDQDMAAQSAKLAQLKDEMARLDALQDQQLKALGLTEESLRGIDLENIPPELKKPLEEAKSKAKLEGERQARESKATTASTTGVSRREGAVRL